MSAKKFSTTKHEADEEPPRFPRPDAKTAAHGSPPHEQAEPEDSRKSTEQRRKDDRIHGYTQEAGYASSGGYEEPPDAEASEPDAGGLRGADGHAASDDQIRDALQEVLTPERTPRGSHIVVNISDGVVTLAGEVPHDAARRQVGEMVHAVAAVRELRNRLNVRAPKGASN